MIHCQSNQSVWSDMLSSANQLHKLYSILQTILRFRVIIKLNFLAFNHQALIMNVILIPLIYFYTKKRCFSRICELKVLFNINRLRLKKSQNIWWPIITTKKNKRPTCCRFTSMYFKFHTFKVAYIDWLDLSAVMTFFM